LHATSSSSFVDQSAACLAERLPRLNEPIRVCFIITACGKDVGVIGDRKAGLVFSMVNRLCMMNVKALKEA